MTRPSFRSFFAAAAATAVMLAGSGRAETVYFTSYSTGALVRYDTTNPAGTITAVSPSGSTTNPAALALGPDGNLYIGQDGDGASIAPSISRFNLTTNTLSTVYTFSSFDVFPGSLAFKGSDLLVGRNPFFANTGPIVKLTNVTGGTVGVSDYTTGGSLASSPGIALAADGSLYVSDQTYNFISGQATGPVKRFDASGTYVGELIADGASGLSGPTGLAIKGTTLYTASIMTGAILQTNLLTDVTTAFASAGGSFEVGALAILSNGEIIAGSPSGSGTIYDFAVNGALLGSFATGFGQIGGIAVVPTAAVPEIDPAMGGSALALVAGVMAMVEQRRRRRGA
jgi:hypothetical protein